MNTLNRVEHAFVCLLCWKFFFHLLLLSGRTILFIAHLFVRLVSCKQPPYNTCDEFYRSMKLSYITVGVEYGLHCLLYLTPPFSHGRDASTRDLAELQGVPHEFLAKLFTKLAKAGLLVASEGARGGFGLAKPAAEITVLDVVEAIDGKKPVFDCREIRSRCAVFDPDKPPAWSTRGVCSIHAVMLAAEQRMREELASWTLADLAARSAEKAPASYTANIVRWLDNRGPARRSERHVD